MRFRSFRSRSDIKYWAVIIGIFSCHSRPNSSTISRYIYSTCPLFKWKCSFLWNQSFKSISANSLPYIVFFLSIVSLLHCNYYIRIRLGNEFAWDSKFTTTKFVFSLPIKWAQSDEEIIKISTVVISVKKNACVKLYYDRKQCWTLNIHT